MKANVFSESIGLIEDFPGALFRSRIVDDELDAFMPGQMADDFRVDPRDRLKLSRPVITIMRPCQPGGLVRLPFRGHAQAVVKGG